MKHASRGSSLDTLQRLASGPELAQLEHYVGRFNIFHVLGAARAELRHSSFLAWLLDPRGSHGLRDRFLRSILLDLLAREPAPEGSVGLKDVERALAGVSVRREWQNIDLLVTIEQPSIVLAIENKIDSFEHDDQLKRYHEELKSAFPEKRTLLVFLTTEGTRGSHAAWLSYSYRDIHRVLTGCTGACDDVTDPEVVTFVNHYLSLIESWFMDDPKVDELCRRVYREHRQALDLIYDRIRIKPTWLLNDLESSLRAQLPDSVVYRLRTELGYAPKAWVDVLPPSLLFDHEDWKGMDRRLWISMYVTVTTTGFEWNFWAGPIEDKSLWQRVVDRLTADPEEFGLRKPKGKATEPYNIDLAREQVVSWEVGTPPESSAFLLEAMKALQALETRLQGIPAAIRSAISDSRRGAPKQAK